MTTKAWTDPAVKSKKQAFLLGLCTSIKEPIGKGRRLVVVHFGSE
jgi:hypothetical protein